MAIAAGLVKLRFRREFTSAVISWNLLGPSGVRALPYGVPIGEVTIGLTALGAAATGHVRIAAIALALLFLGMAAGQAAILRRSSSANCGCFAKTSAPIGWKTIARALVLALLPALALV